MESIEEAQLKAAQAERVNVRASMGENAASALLEGQQKGVAEKRQEAEAQRAAQMEKIQAELKAIEQEVAQLEVQIAELEAKNRETQVKVDQNGPSAGIHRQVMEVRNGEIATLKKDLETKKAELENTREFVNLSRPEEFIPN